MDFIILICHLFMLICIIPDMMFSYFSLMIHIQKRRQMQKNW
jgi:hypothetical protein